VEITFGARPNRHDAKLIPYQNTPSVSSRGTWEAAAEPITWYKELEAMKLPAEIPRHKHEPSSGDRYLGNQSGRPIYMLTSSLLGSFRGIHATPAGRQEHLLSNYGRMITTDGDGECCRPEITRLME